MLISIEWLDQILKAILFYGGIILLCRSVGKRQAGQSTTFDLIILISLGVVLQQVLVNDGKHNSLIFFFSVLAAHKVLGFFTARSEYIRCLVRGSPKELVRDGQIIQEAMHKQNISQDELQAGLRKLGIEDVAAVKLAMLEETGHISAIKM